MVVAVLLGGFCDPGRVAVIMAHGRRPFQPSFDIHSDRISSPRPRLYAALIVAAAPASAGDIFICAEASVRTNSIEGVGDDPGLKSVARTTANPASIIARASG